MKHTTQIPSRCKSVQLFLSSSDGHRAFSPVASPRRELPNAATCRPFRIGTSARVLRPKPVNLHRMVLRTKPPIPSDGFEDETTKPSDVDACPTSAKLDAIAFLLDSTNAIYTSHVDVCPASAKCHNAIASTLTWPTPSSSPMYTCACRCPQVSATAASHPASWSLGPSLASALHHSRSVGTARLYLTFTLPLTTVSELHTCASQAKRHVAQHTRYNTTHATPPVSH